MSICQNFSEGSWWLWMSDVLAILFVDVIKESSCRCATDQKCACEPTASCQPPRRGRRRHGAARARSGSRGGRGEADEPIQRQLITCLGLHYVQIDDSAAVGGGIDPSESLEVFECSEC